MKRSVIEYQELKVMNDDNLFMLVVKFVDGGWRCGYIGVPKNSPLYAGYGENVGGFCDVHGGITFDGFLDDNETWWYFGFDCAHLNDAIDFRTAKLYFPQHKQNYEEVEKIRYDQPEAHVWSLNDVKKELSEFLDQLVDLLNDKDKMKTLNEYNNELYKEEFGDD